MVEYHKIIFLFANIIIGRLEPRRYGDQGLSAAGNGSAVFLHKAAKGDWLAKGDKPRVRA